MNSLYAGADAKLRRQAIKNFGKNKLLSLQSSVISLFLRKVVYLIGERIMKIIKISTLLLLFSLAALAQDDDIYSIQEHGPGRWVSFSTPLNVQHNLTTQGLLGYELIFNPDFEIRTQGVLYAFRFEEIGKFNAALKPQLPANTHMQFIIDGKPTSEIKVQKTGFRNENDSKHVLKFVVVGNKQMVESMTNARSVRGLLYFRDMKNEKIDVKSFTLDPRMIRTLAKLITIAK